MSDDKTIEPITPERVERDRARLLAMAEFFMTTSETLLHMRVPVPWSPTPPGVAPTMLHELMRPIGLSTIPLAIDRGMECTRLAVLCFEAATRKDKP